MCAESRALETPQHPGVPTLQPWLLQGPAQLRLAWLPDPMQTSKARETPSLICLNFILNFSLQFLMNERSSMCQGKHMGSNRVWL